MRFITCIYCLLLSIFLTPAIAQENETGNSKSNHNAYWGNSFEGGMFSTAFIKSPYNSNTMGTLRFSYVINAGITYNYDLDNSFGVFTGLNIKNLGFIEKVGDSTVKRRTYNLGVPLAIKLGNLSNYNFFFAGIDIEMPFNYKEKGFVSRGHKTKFNDWFSARTPTFMPAIFAGFTIKKGLSLKLEYYLNNFMNPEFAENGIKPYTGYDVHLLTVNVGMELPYRRKHSHKDKNKLKSL